MRALAIAALLAAVSVVAPARAQDPAPTWVQATEPDTAEASGEAAPSPQSASGTLVYGGIDNATVRVFSVIGVGTARIRSASNIDRLFAIPESGHGSGLLISRDGLVLTARHVVEDAQLLAVWVPGQSRAYPASVVYSDPERDFAVLVIPGVFENHVPLVAPTEALRVRQTVHAIGYPLDARRSDPQSSRGIISGIRPTGDLQLDMALNPGNSGGPLIDESDRILGIVVARGDPSRGVQNIGVRSRRARSRRRSPRPCTPETRSRALARGCRRTAATTSRSS